MRLIPNGGILVVPDATIIAHRDLFILFAGPYRLPAVYPWPAISSQPTHSCLSELTTSGAAEGGVLCIDRILRGAKAVTYRQAPAKYQTALNLKTARTLGLT